MVSLVEMHHLLSANCVGLTTDCFCSVLLLSSTSYSETAGSCFQQKNLKPTILLLITKQQTDTFSTQLLNSEAFSC